VRVSFKYIQEASDEKDKTPPVLIIVCDNTDIAELFYRNISGEQEIEVEVESKRGRRRKKTVTRTVYGDGRVFPEHFSNRENFRPTVRIDSKLLAQAEAAHAPGGDPTVSREEAAEQLRRIVATVGVKGRAGGAGALRRRRGHAQRGLGRPQRHPHPGIAGLR